MIKYGWETVDCTPRVRFVLHLLTHLVAVFVIDKELLFLATFNILSAGINTFSRGSSILKFNIVFNV